MAVMQLSASIDNRITLLDLADRQTAYNNHHDQQSDAPPRRGLHGESNRAPQHVASVAPGQISGNRISADQRRDNLRRDADDFPYGERQYSVEDLAGHRWTFTQAIADLAPEDWGGTSKGLPLPD
jgi:hypothetical protein